MNAFPFRGLAALALVCLLVPRAGALTITETFSYDVFRLFGQGNGTNNSVGARWDYSAFNPALGTLEGVSFLSTTTASVHLFEINHFLNYALPGPTPVTVVYTPSVTLSLHQSSTDGIGGSSATTASGPTVTLAPAGTVNFTANLTTSVFVTTSVPLELDYFSGAAIWPFNGPPHRAGLNTNFSGNNYFGSISINGTTTSTLTYTYRAAASPVPDGGGTAGLLAVSAGVVMLGGAHRRRVSCSAR